MNWSGKPLVSHEVIVDLIKATKTAQGLRVEAEIDPNIYPAGQKVSDEEMAQIREEVAARFAREIQRERVVVMVDRSQDAARLLSSAHRSDPLDWAYVDGDHTYEAVLADLRAFWTLIRDGGCLAGDDYGIKGWWNDGVTRAVDEFAASVDRSPLIIGSQFLIRK